MKQRTMDCERWSVVVVPFPFTDRARVRRRPAVVVSRPEALAERVGHSVLAMVTSAQNPSWPLDVPLSDRSKAGLEAPSVVRMKLFTLDHRFILRTIGRLGDDDRAAVAVSLAALLGTEDTDAGARRAETARLCRQRTIGQSWIVPMSHLHLMRALPTMTALHAF